MNKKLKNTGWAQHCPSCAYIVTFLLVSCILHLASVPNADASYKIYLKNGSVITGVSHYEKAGGEVRFYFGGAMIGIPENDILKIESGNEPVKDLESHGKSSEQPAMQPSAGESKAEEAPAQVQPSETDKSAEIAKKEEELTNLKEDLTMTRVRIQNLFFKSQQGTITSDEQVMLQQNMFKRKDLDDKIKKLEDEIQQLKASPR